MESLLDFRSRVRSRLQKLYGDIETGERTLDRETARVLFMTLEHEALHLEVRVCVHVFPAPCHYTNYSIDPIVHALAACWEWHYPPERVHQTILGESLRQLEVSSQTQ